MKKTLALLLLGINVIIATAQFTGPAGTGRSTTIQQARDARIGSYVTIVGNIIEHQRDDYYTFSDATGQIRVQVDPEIWQNRPVSPATKIRLQGEIEWALTGRYISAESLQVVE